IPVASHSTSLIFFFQAEDGIRDRNVTGVQTCALPICGGAVPDRPSRLVDPEPLARAVVGDPAVVHQVSHRHPVVGGHHVGDDPPVAPPPHGFRTHHGGAPLPCVRDHPLQRGAEPRVACPRAVGAERLDAPPRVGGVAAFGRRESAPPAELFLPAVVDARVGGELGHRTLGGGWIRPAARKTPDVHQQFDARAGEQAGEPVPVQGPVPHGQKHQFTVLVWSSSSAPARRRAGCATATSTAPTSRPNSSAQAVSTSQPRTGPTPAMPAAGSARRRTRWYGAVAPSSSMPTRRMWPPTQSMASMPTKE